MNMFHAVTVFVLSECLQFLKYFLIIYLNSKKKVVYYLNNVRCINKLQGQLLIDTSKLAKEWQIADSNFYSAIYI